MGPCSQRNPHFVNNVIMEKGRGTELIRPRSSSNERISIAARE
jgi:hypothetical protein